MFRRRRSVDEPAADDPVEAAERDSAEEDAIDDPAGRAGAGAPAEPAALPHGPWDGEDPPRDELNRLDLGGIAVPVFPGVEVRVDVDQQGQVVAATVVDGPSSMQVNAFAAPKSAGIWAQVRTEIVASLRSTGGSAEEVEGSFGTELRAQVPAEAPGQAATLAPARFLGIDGPRWFLRGLISGPAALESAAAEPLESVLRGVVVHRGKDAMAPRDALPLRLPRELAEAAQSGGDQRVELPATPPPGEAPREDDFQPFERGPEITETR